MGERRWHRGRNHVRTKPATVIVGGHDAASAIKTSEIWHLKTERRHWLLTSLVFLMLVPCVSGSWPQKLRANGLSLWGFVKTDKNSPVGGAIVRVEYPDTGIDTVALTDALGKFRIPQLKQDKYE